MCPDRRQAIIGTSAGVLRFGPMGKNQCNFQQSAMDFHSRKLIWNCRLQNGGHIASASVFIKLNQIKKKPGNDPLIHDDVIKWKHFPRHWPFVRGIPLPPVNSPHKGQWRGALMFSVIGAWANDWVNNWNAGDLRHYRAHYDIIVMINASHDHPDKAPQSIFNRKCSRISIRNTIISYKIIATHPRVQWVGIIFF